jgi:uncharacterized protein
LDIAQALIGNLSPGLLLLAVSAVFFAGFLRGFVGFGAALIITMVFSVIYGPTMAVPIATLSGLPATLQLLPAARRDADPAFVLPFGLAAFVAAPLGAWILVSLDATVMRMLISLFVLAMVMLLYAEWRALAVSGRRACAGAGAIAGFVQGASSVSGPLAVLVALSRPGATRQQRANVIGVVTSLNLCGLIPFAYHGLFTLEVAIISVAIIPIYSAATWLGACFFSGRGHRFFRNAALLAMALISLTTFSLAVRDSFL